MRYFFTIFLLCILAGCTENPPPGEGFYTYDGFRDWWRIPVSFPYHIVITDTFRSGSLETYNPEESIADPNISSRAALESDIIGLALTESYAIFHHENGKYSLLLLKQGKLSFYYDSVEQVMADKRVKDLQNPNDAAAPVFIDLEQAYRNYWNKK